LVKERVVDLRWRPVGKFRGVEDIEHALALGGIERARRGGPRRGPLRGSVSPPVKAGSHLAF
jgi:hypothetical protein